MTRPSTAVRISAYADLLRELQTNSDALTYTGDSVIDNHLSDAEGNIESALYHLDAAITIARTLEENGQPPRPTAMMDLAALTVFYGV